MGLAASQARFLGLTARKSNIEYQGQQINQARTTLSNEVMGLYSEYSELEVPTAPSKYDYVKTTYTIDSTYEDYEITNFSKITDGEYEGYYNVTLSYDEEVEQTYSTTLRDTVVTVQKNDDGSYSYINFAIGTNSYTYEEDSDDNTLTKTTKDGKTYYTFTMNDTEYTVEESDLDSTTFTTEGDNLMYYGDFTFDYQGTKTTTKSIQAIAALTQDSSGRLSSINILECDDDQDLVGNSYSITVGQEDDETGYQEALNAYNYDKDVYEKELAELNAKIEKIQTEDKALEMKLAQLDTEQEAIATEMDSVSQVIDDTIDKLFDSDS